MGQALVAVTVIIVLAVIVVTIVAMLTRAGNDDNPRRRELLRLKYEHKVNLETIAQVEQLLDRYPGLDVVGEALVSDVREVIRNNRQRMIEENR